MVQVLPYTVNCSILLTDLPLLERPAAARAAGFEGVEFWWPFPVAVPDADDVDAFVGAIRDAGVQLTGLNLHAGDMPGGDRGLISLPERSAELRANLDVVTDIAGRTGCQGFNALYGNRVEGADAAAQDALGAENLALAARAVARVGGTILLEPLSGAAAYPLKTSADAVAVLDRVVEEHGDTNLGLLLDVYHLAANGADVPTEIATYRDRVAHVQVADAPGRGVPGSGAQPITDWIEDLRAGGYTGPVGLEYQSADPDPFGWLPREQRA
ncbi:hydroxypyruvate isomerase family protein [Georgenia subflava]|uniref:TIM barrel protein n=1 Tax=Georgenia subflava TaxID=1622177 RepID=A0A6N7ENR7_9MICO|nr:TIM barrel protein [Georgenia subflava]MPV38758.1 TIM barrel protein [Georgenia subflava]